MSLVSESDQQRVSDAIRAAESRTRGEIVAVIARESASYLSVPVMLAALAALLVPWPLIYLTWTTVQAIYLLQLAAFAVLLLTLMPRPVRVRLVPRAMKVRRAHDRAVEQFLIQDLDTSAGRTGVLIFVSVAERYAEIIADKGLHPKVAQSEWQAIVDRMTIMIGAGRAGDAIVEAVGLVGEIMARHFPASPSDVRRLPDHLIVLD
jgi:putative membrane protein